VLENVDLSLAVPKAAYKAARKELESRLVSLQRGVIEHRIPVILVFEGMAAAGKGTLINELIQPLDPRGFNVLSMAPPTVEERLRPFLWRFWIKTPARGRIALFDRSWYRSVTVDRVDGLVRHADVPDACEDIRSFERQLADDGCLIVKFFLHISKEEQKRRFKKLLAKRQTAWRVSPEDRRRYKSFKVYLRAVEEMLGRTDTEFAPWTVLAAHDHRAAALKMFETVAAALERRINADRSRVRRIESRKGATSFAAARTSLLDRADLSLSLKEPDYRRKLAKRQEHLRELEHEIYARRIPVVIAFEGWDAAGKGGAIRRLTGKLDPRGYEVAPIAAPSDVEKAHHFLWRFWNQIPKAGHITIFDRSWYGRVLVERVEGFCSEAEWTRAYREINEMERHLTNFGTVLVKFWLHIDPAEQLRRFKARESDELRRWKITPDDWRNRKKWNAYKAALEEMFLHTSTPNAPWTIVESNCKWYARIKTLDTVIAAIEARLGEGKSGGRSAPGCQ
jgi:polyphosphate:AMP phosphotransferase